MLIGDNSDLDLLLSHLAKVLELLGRGLLVTRHDDRVNFRGLLRNENLALLNSNGKLLSDLLVVGLLDSVTEAAIQRRLLRLDDLGDFFLRSAFFGLGADEANEAQPPDAHRLLDMVDGHNGSGFALLGNSVRVLFNLKMRKVEKNTCKTVNSDQFLPKLPWQPRA